MERRNKAKGGEKEWEEFQTIVDGSAMIDDVGEWTIRKACQEARDWPAGLRIAVNVPTQQFSANGFVESVSNVLDETDFDPDRLELEVNESVFLGDANMVDKTDRNSTRLNSSH